MRSLLLLTALIMSATAIAHPNGKYIIAGNSNATMEFKFVGICPAGGDLSGAKRSIQFSSVARKAPYSFVNGIYVETFVDGDEVYVRVNDDCTIHEDEVEVIAEHDSFGGFEIERI